MNIQFGGYIPDTYIIKKHSYMISILFIPRSIEETTFRLVYNIKVENL